MTMCADIGCIINLRSFKTIEKLSNLSYATVLPNSLFFSRKRIQDSNNVKNFEALDC